MQLDYFQRLLLVMALDVALRAVFLTIVLSSLYTAYLKERSGPLFEEGIICCALSSCCGC